MSILDIGISFIESWMKDECTITRDAEGFNDDTLDPDTGLLEAPDSDSIEVYSGKCTYGWLSRKELSYVRGEGKVEKRLYRTMIPVSETNVQNGDIFTLTYSYNDQFLTGEPMRLTEIVGGTHVTYRRFLLEHLAEEKGNPHI